jgi:hypothetical protein
MMGHRGQMRIWAKWVQPVAAVSALVPLFLYYRSVYPSPDQSLFDYLAWMDVNGRTFYAEGFEQNWPGALILHEIATRAFGVHPTSFRTLDFILMVTATIFVAWHWIRRDLPVAGWIFAFTYPVIYVTSGRWMAGERDVLAMNILLVAVVLLLRAEPRSLQYVGATNRQGPIPRRSVAPIIAALFAGALITLSTLIRPTYLFFAVAAGGMLMVRAIAKKSLAAVLRVMIVPGFIGFTALGAIAVIAGLAAGNLDDWYVQTIAFNFEAYQVTEPRRRLAAMLLRTIRDFWPWLAPIAAVGLVSTKDARLRSEIQYGIALLLTVLVSYVVQNKGFPYHLGGLIPIFVLAVAMGLDSCVHWARQSGSGPLPFAAGIIVAALLAVGMISRLEKLTELGAPATGAGRAQVEIERDAVIAILRCETRSTDLVFQWGRLSDILYRAKRLPASRFVSSPALNLLNGQRGREWTIEFARDLQTNKPRMVVTDNDDLPVAQILAAEAPGLSHAARILSQELQANYDIRFAGKHLTLFQRRGAPRLPRCSRMPVSEGPNRNAL